MAEQSSRVQIAIAIIGLVGVLGTAIIANWKTIFSHEDAGSLKTTPTPSPKVSVDQGASVTRSPSPSPTHEPSVKVPPSKCVGNDSLAYNPKDLQIVDEGPSGWLLTDGRSRMLMLDNKEDAEKALALARRHTSHCFIGRSNTRPNRKDYVYEYWVGNSGIETVIPNEDCIPYNPDTLLTVDEGANGFLLTDGRSRMALYATLEDAEEGLRV